MTITEAFRPHHFFNAAFAPYLLVHLEIYSALANGGHPKPIIKPNGKEKKKILTSIWLRVTGKIIAIKLTMRI